MKYSESRISRNKSRGALMPMVVMILLLFAGNFNGLFAQDADPVAGEALFKNNCASCHSTNLANDMTGPALAGLEARMEDNAISKEVLYEWIRNSAKVRVENDYFNELWVKWNKENMNLFPTLSDGDIDNIVAYIYNWTPPVQTTVGGDTAKVEDDEGVNSLWGWLQFLLLVVLALLGNIALQVARLRGVEFLGGIDLNKWNGRIMLGFLVLGLIGVFASVWAYKDTYLLSNSASEHGTAIDSMFWVTMAITFAVFIFTNILLFWFAFRYAGKPGRKARYYPENHKLEMIWTAVPAVVLTILVVFGIKTWNTVMGAPPEEDEKVYIELNAYQFGWQIRYPGPDGKFGDSDVRRISGVNSLGIDFTQPESRDDFISNDLVFPKGKRVVLKIRSRDVLHSAYLPHFRVKMDAVPGMNTRFHFVPTITTDSMRTIKGDTSFVYELACTEVCGKGHFSMRKIVDVMEADAWDRWHAEMAKSPIYNPEDHGVALIEDPAMMKPSVGLTAENKE